LEEVLKIFERNDIAFVMRTFWPVSHVLGESVMQVAEGLAQNYCCVVITQNQSNLRNALDTSGRGVSVKFSSVYALSNSSSNISLRLLDLIWFAFAAFFSLIRRRPKVVYVATDPPLLVPMVVYIYAKIFSAKYVYHVQDIHPEATAIVFPFLKYGFFGFFFRALRWLDGHIVKDASSLITLNGEMKDSLASRGRCLPSSFYFLNNPSAEMPKKTQKNIQYDFAFIGNAGRLQRLPLILDTIRDYLKEGGQKTFAFVGAGVMSYDISNLSKEFPANVTYFGALTVTEATLITLSSDWLLLPIDDEVCRFAFPSKAATYAVSGRKILAICGYSTSVGLWVRQKKLGKVITPSVDALKSFFWLGKSNDIPDTSCKISSRELTAIADELSAARFVKALSIILLNSISMSNETDK